MKIGFLSLPLSGHLNPMTTLARKLKSRGNDVVFFGVPDVEPFARAAGLSFEPFCEKEYPLGSMAEVFGPIAKLHGDDVLRLYLQEIMPAFLKAVLERFPEKLAESGVDGLVLDAAHSYVELVPMSLGISYVQIWNTLHPDSSGATPICVFSWPYGDTPEALARNIEGLRKLGSYFAPIITVAMHHAEKVGLQVDWSDRSSTISKLAVITQTPKEFDFPGIPWPAQFHYAGPLHDNEGWRPSSFVWERLTGKPLIYASLGTLVNGLDHVYKAILEAVAKLPEVQVVLSIGKNVDPEELGPIAPNVVVVRSAPQIELLRCATLCITHAGLNTVLEALAQGVPMVAIPIAYDQPGIAARIAYHGVGEFLQLEDLTRERLLELIQMILKNTSYRDKACHFRKIIAETRGLDTAANLIETGLSKDMRRDLAEEPTFPLNIE